MPAPKPARHDVVVVGDGPAGSALTAALAARGVDAVMVGDDAAWCATYGTWADELEAIEWLGARHCWRDRLDSIAVDVGGRRIIDRPYGIVDNDALRRHLRRDVTHVVARVAPADPARPRRVETDDGVEFTARLVIDATGWPGWSRAAGLGELAVASVPRQTAFGVVLRAPPDGDLGRPTMMDWRSPPGWSEEGGVPTFVYALPVADGWLVEETVLASRPAVPPDALAERLAARLHMSVAELHDAATRIERVDIPMGGPLPDRTSPVVAFGAAAGMIHPATGYSLASSLTRAVPVAEGIAAELETSTVSPEVIWDAVWPASARRTRILHDYGLEVVIDLDADAVRSFFGTFFELSEEQWSAYLRITTEPRQLARVMLQMFRAAPWGLRRRLVSANPLAFARLLRP